MHQEDVIQTNLQKKHLFCGSELWTKFNVENQADFDAKKTVFLRSLEKALEYATKGQSCNPAWHKERQTRLTFISF